MTFLGFSKQINLIYKHLPVDISFVDENELVKFYSDTDHRIFPRSKNVIGRQVSNCHPRKSVHIVEEIVEKFRSGEQDKYFWLINPELGFILFATTEFLYDFLNDVYTLTWVAVRHLSADDIL